MNKKKIAIISVLSILVIGIAIYFIGRSVATVDSTILKNQVVDGLSFTDAKLGYEKGVSTITVNVTNTNKETYSLNYIEIKVTEESGNVITLIGYIGDSIDSEQKKIITASIDKDITTATSLEYIINK